MAFFGLFGKKKKSPSFDYQPYEGLRPPRIDTPDFQSLRPVQKLYTNEVMNRSQGNDVGFDPERRQLLIDLTKSELGKQQEDQLRNAKGSLSSSGLSGNPRAYEALAGRVQRDTGRNLSDALSKISIEDLTRANEERDTNTARLGDLNQFNFGQENNDANFDLNVYNNEQANRLNAFNANEGVRRADQSNQNDMLSGLGELIPAGISLATGNPAPLMMQAAGSLMSPKSSGTGISPDYGSLINTTSGPGYRKAYRNNVR